MPYNKFYASLSDSADNPQLQRIINTIQGNVDNAVKGIEGTAPLGGIFLDNIVLNTGSDVAHKLGREPKGYFVTKKNSNVNIWNGTINSNTISLYSSGNVTISIYIF